MQSQWNHNIYECPRNQYVWAVERIDEEFADEVKLVHGGEVARNEHGYYLAFMLIAKPALPVVSTVAA